MTELTRSTSLFDRLETAADAVRARCAAVPDVAVVLGSGLGDVVATMTNRIVLPYRELPHWPAASVKGHRSELVIGRLGRRVVAMLAGRVHGYEGYPFDDVVFATRVMGRLGIRQLILTNAAGGINPALQPGMLMVIDDHINLLGGSPLAGANDERLGPRFPDMSEVYSSRLRVRAHEAAHEHGVSLAHGVYAAVPGPSYETPAEVRYLRAIGADAVGMSVVPEAIAARHMGIELLGLSCITNAAAGLNDAAAGAMGPASLRHDGVLAAAQQASERLARILRGVVDRM